MVPTRSEFGANDTREVVQNIIQASSHSRDDLGCYLNSLPLKVLRKAVALMYLGRGGSGTTYSGILAQPLDCYRTKVAAIRKLIEKQPSLRGYLEKGLRNHDPASLES